MRVQLLRHFYHLKVSRLLLLVPLLLCYDRANAQLLPTDSLTKKFDRARTLQEKLYVHTDRSLYLTGEVLWFKIYCAEGSLHRPLDVSKVTYVEVLDKMNEPVLQAKIFMKGGVGNGSFFIPTSLGSGNYTLRAYTNWMKNFGAGYYFQQDITIINPFVKLEAEPAISTPKTLYDVQFFPEGGDLVSSIKSKIGFKVSDRAGKGVDFHGAIVNERNDTLVRFTPAKFGMGTFYFTPDKSEHYRAIIKDSKRVTVIYKLPEVKDNGIVMHLKDSADRISVDVFSSSTNVTPVYLFVQTRQIIDKVESKFLQYGKTSFQLNRKDLPEGISQITLFDEKQQPICERLYFKKPVSNLTLSLKTDLLQYDVRRKVSLQVSASQQVDISVAVYKVDSLPVLPQQNIFEYLWLSSDVQGLIESPEYYFGNSADVNEVTDNLMLTQGWRRFTWSDVVNKQNSIRFIPEYHSHIIRGHVFDNAGAPVKEIQTYLAKPGKIIKVYGSRSNALGEVQFEMQDFWGVHKIAAQTNLRVDSLYHVTIESPFSINFASHKAPLFALPSSYEKQLINRSVSMQVQDIYNRSQTEIFTKPLVDSTAFYGKADETYLLDDFTRFPVMEEIMREYVPGVFVRKHKDGFHFIVLDNVNKGVFRDNPMVLLDGLPVFDVNKIMELDPLKVKKLEVVTRKYYDGPLVFQGIVSYTTYKGDLNGFQLDPRVVSVNYEGLQLQREFYSPKYDNPALRDTRTPDSRSLLYWNPSFTTDKGNNNLEFYTSDLTGTFQVVIQGLTKDGKAGSGFHTFYVKKELN